MMVPKKFRVCQSIKGKVLRHAQFMKDYGITLVSVGAVEGAGVAGRVPGADA